MFFVSTAFTLLVILIVCLQFRSASSPLTVSRPPSLVPTQPSDGHSSPHTFTEAATPPSLPNVSVPFVPEVSSSGPALSPPGLPPEYMSPDRTSPKVAGPPSTPDLPPRHRQGRDEGRRGASFPDGVVTLQLHPILQLHRRARDGGEGVTTESDHPGPLEEDRQTPLRTVAVHLLRQRQTPLHWAADLTRPIVAIVPTGSPRPTPFFPLEVLVEEYRSDDAGPKKFLDPLYHVAATVRRESTPAGDAFSISNGASAVIEKHEIPLLSIRPSTTRHATDQKEEAREPAGLTWSANGVDAFSFQLYEVTPNVRRYPHRTTALAMTAELPPGSRVYGLPRTVNGTRTTLLCGSRTSISSEYHGMVQGADGRGASPSSGVLPLLFVDLPNGTTVGILWLNAAPFSASVAAGRNGSLQLRMKSTAGRTQLYLLPGLTPSLVRRQYYSLTGFPMMPPLFAFGYHHQLPSGNERAVRELSGTFWKRGLPLEAIGVSDRSLHQGGTPFTWNPKPFPDVLGMQWQLWQQGRRYFVGRLTPTLPILQSSPLYQTARQRDYFVLENPVEDGAFVTIDRGVQRVHVIDFLSPSVRLWFGKHFRYHRYSSSTNYTFVDLVDAAPDVLAAAFTLPLDSGHVNGIHHGQVHNAFSLYFAMSVYHGLLRRTQYMRRPLVTIGNYFAGVQHYGVLSIRPACSDSAEQQEPWSILVDAVQQCAVFNAMGIPFVGVQLLSGVQLPASRHDRPIRVEAAELVARWYQAGSVLPFMTSTSDGLQGLLLALEATKEGQSPTAPTDPPHTADFLRAAWEALRLRYALLPYLYTTAWRASQYGDPVVLPGSEVWRGLSSSGCVHVGNVLVACPITAPGGQLDVQLPMSSVNGYRCYWTGSFYAAGARLLGLPEDFTDPLHWLGQGWRAKGNVHRLPLFLKVGGILPTFTSFAGSVHSTRTILNLSLTVALPDHLAARHAQSLAQPQTDVVLAAGEWYWDSGNENVDVAATRSAAQGDTPHRPHTPNSTTSCHLVWTCSFRSGLLVLVTALPLEANSACLEVLQSHIWRDAPPAALQQWLKLRDAKKDAEMRQQQREAEEVADRGLRRFSARSRANVTAHDSFSQVPTALHRAWCLSEVRWLLPDNTQDRAWWQHRMVDSPSKASGAYKGRWRDGGLSAPSFVFAEGPSVFGIRGDSKPQPWQWIVG